jgi:hypothetical protein
MVSADSVPSDAHDNRIVQPELLVDTLLMSHSYYQP